MVDLDWLTVKQHVLEECSKQCPTRRNKIRERISRENGIAWQLEIWAFDLTVNWQSKECEYYNSTGTFSQSTTRYRSCLLLKFICAEYILIVQSRSYHYSEEEHLELCSLPFGIINTSTSQNPAVSKCWKRSKCAKDSRLVAKPPGRRKALTCRTRSETCSLRQEKWCPRTKICMILKEKTYLFDSSGSMWA